MRYQYEVKFEAEQDNSGRELPGIFGPDVLLPAQYAHLIRGRQSLQGEQRLMFGVLEDGIDCFTKYLDWSEGRGGKLFTEAESWIFRRDPAWLFSFDNVCEFLHLDPEFMRRGLDGWRRQQRAIRGARPGSAQTHARTIPVGRRKLGALVTRRRRRINAQNVKTR